MFLQVVQTRGGRAKSTLCCDFNFFSAASYLKLTFSGRYETPSESDDGETNKTFSDVVGMKDWEGLVVKWDEFLHGVYRELSD